MDFVEDFGSNVNKYSQIREHKNIFSFRGQDHPLTFNQRPSYYDSFKLHVSGMFKW